MSKLLKACLAQTGGVTSRRQREVTHYADVMDLPQGNMRQGSRLPQSAPQEL